jgi:tight adherence protein C
MSALELAAAGLAAGAILLIFLGIFGSLGRGRVQARLNQLGVANVTPLEELDLEAPFLERTIRPMIARFTRVLGRTSSTSFAERTAMRLAQAGYPRDMSVSDWLALKVVVAIAAAVVVGGLFYLIGAGISTALLLTVASVGVGYILPEFWLSRRIRSRHAAILRMTPDSLDLLMISVRAGLGFDGALAKVVEKLDGPLSDEFRRALAEIRIGKSRRDALRDIIPRANVRALSNFIGAIIQADQLGVPIGKVLQVQSEQIRIERRQRAEEAAAKAPIKMLLPLVGCVFPSLFVVILGPAVILILNSTSS